MTSIAHHIALSASTPILVGQTLLLLAVVFLITDHYTHR